MMKPKERYKAQWCKSFMELPEETTDEEVLEMVKGTEAEKQFSQHFGQKKFTYQLRQAIKNALPAGIKKLIGIDK